MSSRQETPRTSRNDTRRADTIVSLTARVVGHLRFVHNLDDILVEALELEPAELRRGLEDARLLSLSHLLRFATVAKEIGEQLHAERDWGNADFWAARQQLDDRVMTALGGTPAGASAAEETPPMLDPPDIDIRRWSADVAAALHVRSTERGELARRAAAAGTSVTAFKVALVESGLRLALGELNVPRFIRLGPRWETDDRGRKRRIAPASLEPKDQQRWMEAFAKAEVIADLRDGHADDGSVELDELAHAWALEVAEEDADNREVPWEDDEDEALEAMDDEAEHPGMHAGFRAVALRTAASTAQVNALPSIARDLLDKLTAEQQRVILARAQPECASWADADRLLGATEGYSRDVARKIRRRWMPPEWGDPGTAT